jgi:thiazole synthase
MNAWTLGSKKLTSRLLLGTARYPSPEMIKKSVERSRAEVVTVSLRRQNPVERSGDAFWSLVKESGAHILPNTAGCRSVKEAVTTAHLARELFQTNWIKLEVIGDEYSLLPDPFGLVEAAQILCEEGFEVFPYMSPDLVVAERLVIAGCKILMPLGSPIGTGKGITDPLAFITLRARFPQTTLILDAGVGKPSHASFAMELGLDGVLLNTAVATATDPPLMAEAFAHAVEAGRRGYEAGLMGERNTAVPSTPTLGTPFWHEAKA